MEGQSIPAYGYTPADKYQGMEGKIKEALGQHDAIGQQILNGQ